MKTPKSLAVFLILAPVSFLLVACEKRSVMAPEPDKEFQSSVDVSWALQVISDIDMVCSHSGEDDLADETNFFWETPESLSPNTLTPSRDSVGKYISMSFNEVICRDGHTRSGTISMNYKPSNPNANYYRDFEFKGKVQLFNYKIDGWSVSLLNDFTITNNVNKFDYDPKTANLSWTLNGDFEFKHPTDPSKNMHCNATIIKTLKNAASTGVFPSRFNAIKWKLAVVEYKGTIFGETSGSVPFKYVIRDSKPLVRDFQCSPENVKSFTGTETPRSPYQQHHPLIDGIADFTTSGLYPRVIYYGSEDGSSPSCDNSGVIMIKGISYPIDFQKVYN